MPRIDAHTVALHRVVDFVDDRLPGSLNTEDLRNFDNMVRRRLFPNNALRSHHFLQTITFHEQLLVAFLAAIIILILNVDNGSVDCMDALEGTVSKVCY